MPTVTVIQPKAADAERSLRVAAYCRVSTSSDDQLNSYITQVNYYSHKFDGSETETLVDIYADEGITGTCEAKRMEFQILISDCRKGKIDRIYVKSISRFARNTRDCLTNIRELKSLGVTVMFEKENIDTANISDELMITIMGGLAQEESSSISQNLKWSIQRKMKKGIYCPHIAPFGYRLLNNTFVVEESEAQVVREIFTMFVSGNGTQCTTDYINKKYGGIYKLSCSRIRYILKNEKYTGDSLFQKYYTPDIIGAKCQENKGQKDMYYIKDTHQAIISRELYETAQMLLKQRYITRGKPINYFLTKKLKCARCGSYYQRKLCSNICYWVCHKHDNNSRDCASERIKESDIESAFVRLFNKLLFNYEELFQSMQKSLQDLELKQTVSNTNIIELRRNILQLKEQLKVIAELRTKGFLNEAKFNERAIEINAKINRAYKDIELLSQSDDTILKGIEMLIDYFEKREHIMIKFEPEAFEILIDRIVVNGEFLEFHLIGGLILTEKI